MKKTFVILTIVLAMLAAPVFAEITASGEANFAWGFNADDYEENIDTNDVVLDLGGTVGEYTSISAEFEYEADYSDNVSAGDVDAITGIDNEGNLTTKSAVWANELTITQDVTGALGIDNGVSLAITVGISDFDPEEYNDMAYNDFDLDGELDPGTVMTKLSVGIQDMVTIDAAFYEKGLGVNAYGNIADMADVSVYYLMDFYTGGYDYDVTSDAKDANVFGVNAAIEAMDGLTLGAGVEMATWDTASDDDYYTAYGLSAVYTGVDMMEFQLGTNTELSDGDDDFAENTQISAAAYYSVSDMISLNAGVTMPVDAGDDDFADVLGYEIGASAVVDGLTYQAGYTLRSDNEAFDGGFTDDAGNFYLKMSASF